MSDDEVRAAFDVAEEIRDPLDGLADRSKLDKAAPFSLEVLERLAELRQHDRGAFEALRPVLRASGVRLTALDDAFDGVDAISDGSEEKARKQSDILIDLAGEAYLNAGAVDGSGPKMRSPVSPLGWRGFLYCGGVGSTS